MVDEQNKVTTEFTQSLDDVQNQLTKFQDVLDRTLKALAKHGVQLSVDLPAMVREQISDLDVVERKARRVVRQVDRQRELVDTVALITSSLELDQVLAEVMDTVIELTGAERAYLMLQQRNSEELNIRAARNWDRETISDDDAMFSRSIVNAAIEGKEAIVTTNAQDDERFQGAMSVADQKLRSILCIPLIMHGRVVGVLYADNRVEQGLFDQNDIPLLTAFGTQAAIAIENARAYGKVQNDLRETKRELQQLKIQIDRDKVSAQVSEIVGSDYFERLAEAAREIRESRPRAED